MPRKSKHSNSMTEMLNSLVGQSESKTISVGQIIDNLKHRGFGPMLAILGLLIIVVGAIPLVPALLSLIVCFVSVQILLDKAHPWVPKKIRNLKINRSKLKHGLNFIKPTIRKMERLLKTRLTLFFNRVSEIIIAFTCLALALAIILIGFIPMVPALFALPILMFGVGYIAQDGLVIFIGFLLLAISSWLLFF